jgi:putative addiction module CopG family antidote
MNIPLAADLQEYIAELVDAGRYSAPEQVLEEALREHRARHGRGEIVMTAELERLLDEGLENLDQTRDTEELRRT